MKIALIVLGIIATVAVAITVVGWSLPVGHRASRQATYPATPDAIYSAITKVEDFPAWRSNVARIEIVESQGSRSFREISGDGSILYVVDEELPVRRLVTRIADPSLPFGGTWTFELLPATTGTTLRITENGEVYNPVFRFMSKFVFSHHATIDTYLKDLGTRFGAEPVITT